MSTYRGKKAPLDIGAETAYPTSLWEAVTDSSGPDNSLGEVLLLPH